MDLFDVIALILYFILLLASIFMIIQFYSCDDHTCKAYKVAAKEGPEGSQEFTLALLFELYNDGVWPLAFVGSAILTGLFFYFAQVPFTVRSYMIFFLVGFIVVYFLFAFMAHHYVKPIALSVGNFLDSNVTMNNLKDNTNTIIDEKKQV